MARESFVLTVAGIVILFFCSAASADVPQIINYQGKLTTAQGGCLNDTVQMTFSIYPDTTGSPADWTETQTGVIVKEGIFNVLLGSVNPIPDTVFDGSVKYLGVQVESDPEMRPLKPMVSVAYAYRAGTVDGGGGGWVDDGTVVRLEDTTDQVGIGTTTPSAKLDVVGDVNIDGRVLVGTDLPIAQLGVVSSYANAGCFKSDSLSDDTHVLHSEFTGSGNYDAVAVYGHSFPADGYGFGGKFTGGHVGVMGSVQPTGSKSHWGVIGSVSGGSGTNYGVRGFAEGPGANYAIYGYTTDSEPPTYAGYFSGLLHATSVSATIKAFKIDHPLDPENKYLYHSSVESPDMMNVYNGNVILNANGEARVQLPDYFETINKDFRYQLTAIGAPGPDLYVAEEISGNSFKIAGGESGMKVSWQVTGIRNDPVAEANRIQVEVDKPAQERGKYLNPEAYGLGEEYGMHYEQNKRLEERR